MSEFRAYPAVRHVLQICYANLGFALYVSWPWMVIIGILQFGLQLSTPDHETADPQYLTTTFPLLLLYVIVSTVGFSSLSVNWHRYVLRAEKAEGWLRLRLDRPVWRYVGSGLLLGMLGTGILLTISLPAYFFLGSIFAVLTASFGSTMSWVLLSVLAVVLFGLLGVSLLRLAIKFPAIALERNDYGFRDAWKDTYGHVFSLIGFWLLFMMAVLIIALAVALVLVIPAVALSLAGMDSAALAASFASQFAGNWIGIFLGISALTSLYGIFAEGREV